MRKIITSVLAAVTFGGALAAAAAPAQARDYDRGDYYRHGHHGGGNTAAIAGIAGIAGLALGAALSSRGGGNHGYASSGYAYRNGYSYDPRYDSYRGDYYGDGYYARPERICISHERVWDPYIERNVSIERRYPC
ncbi:hypothetical protein [Phenylobacterium sp.]|uniref:hypothetical protein n=1 Tax=Phenylobacterium sp. TaxID=1871053 RepID=UPI0025F34AC2|nr:hypothetical protein [Phenylobacterium sp.]